MDYTPALLRGPDGEREDLVGTLVYRGQDSASAGDDKDIGVYMVQESALRKRRWLSRLVELSTGLLIGMRGHGYQDCEHRERVLIRSYEITTTHMWMDGIYTRSRGTA